MRKLALICALLMFALPVFADEEPATEAKGEGHSFFGMTTHPYTKLTLSRINSDGVQWSTGFGFGVEVDAGGAYVDLHYQLHDILTDESNQSYPWDGTFEIGVGMYW